MPGSVLVLDYAQRALLVLGASPVPMMLESSQACLNFGLRIASPLRAHLLRNRPLLHNAFAGCVLVKLCISAPFALQTPSLAFRSARINTPCKTQSLCAVWQTKAGSLLQTLPVLPSAQWLAEHGQWLAEHGLVAPVAQEPQLQAPWPPWPPHGPEWPIPPRPAGQWRGGEFVAGQWHGGEFVAGRWCGGEFVVGQWHAGEFVPAKVMPER